VVRVRSLALVAAERNNRRMRAPHAADELDSLPGLEQVAIQRAVEKLEVTVVDDAVQAGSPASCATSPASSGTAIAGQFGRPVQRCRRFFRRAEPIGTYQVGRGQTRSRAIPAHADNVDAFQAITEPEFEL
jgi:hypothetical protein